MSKLYLITGPAGVGKSTVSKELASKSNKSVLIEGDDIYHQVVGGYVKPWEDGNHLDLFWDIVTDMIRTYLDSDYDVIFNYIINPLDLDYLKIMFDDIETRFVILITDAETLLDRDKQRSVDCQMGNRCIELLKGFTNKNYEERYFLDTSNKSVEEVVKEIDNNIYKT